jgi:hypothetical protein
MLTVQNLPVHLSGTCQLGCSPQDLFLRLKAEAISRPGPQTPCLVQALFILQDPLRGLDSTRKVELAGPCGEKEVTCLERGTMVVSPTPCSPGELESTDMIAPSHRQSQVQADTDTPYPRSKAGGMSTNWTTYQDGAPADGDYRYSLGHRGRIREGRV